MGRDDRVRLLIMRHRYDALSCIATPREGMAHCATHAQYVARHHEEMTAKRRGFPALGFREPWPEAPGAEPFVVDGKWIVVCACGDAPMASPEWDEARCFGCGAIYRGLVWPADRLEIESMLLRRPAAVRTWLPGETVDDLREQNLSHGVA